MNKRPLVIAHRGFSGRYPENTLAAIRAALDLGVDFVEIDVHQTRDRELIVFHDYRLNRICGVPGRVCDKTWAQIRRLKQQVPTLAEVLRLCRGKAEVLIEIKRADPRKIATMIRKLHMEGEVIVFSLSIPRLKAFAAAAPGITRFGLVARNWASSLLALRSSGAVRGIGLSRRLVTSPSVVQELHRRGWKVFVWTVNRQSEMKRLARYGVDGLITNHPDLALRLRDAHEL